MILCDTCIIVAAIRVDDDDHAAAFSLLDSRRTPVVTTWPCVTEAMYLCGPVGQEKLFQQIERGVYSLPPPTIEDALRACVLMRQYADTPMDFADASLVVAAERLGINQVLTFDGHFYAYRIDGKKAFDVIPGPS